MHMLSIILMAAGVVHALWFVILLPEICMFLLLIAACICYAADYIHQQRRSLDE